MKKHGYPDKSIVLEWGNQKSAVDIAIVSKDYKTPIAIFEIKGYKTPQNIRAGIIQMQRACTSLNLSVPVSLVFGTKQAPYFEVVDISDIVFRNEEIDVESMMRSESSSEPISYDAVQSASLGKEILKKHQDKKERIDRIIPFCWFWIPLIAIALLLLDAFNIYVFTTERLAFFGALLIILLLPFFSEISFKDFSVKIGDRFKKKNEQELELTQKQHKSKNK